MSNEKFSISIAGENALILHLTDGISTLTTAKIQAIVTDLREKLSASLIDIIPSYASILVIYEPLHTDHFAVRKSLQKAAKNIIESRTKSSDGISKLVTLPAYYSTDSGPDLATLASEAGLSINQVIDIHTSTEYRVYAIGFAPGFAYLGEVDQKIATPRLATPRQKVPRGSVAIADRQTAVYPAESPGGWNIIGLCPTLMFDPLATPSMPLATGDRVMFEPITRDQFLGLGGTLGRFEAIR
ncbi:MAG: 5-oxoprolinase subunit PxpB [Porticoccaceae bacterium]|nr:5-oxoprolinase subunit PxpB [Porticoccaceae bacterium]MDG1473744.1 5-oxoprolinase subunit PxpB [Porticoccaceae bacterium]